MISYLAMSICVWLVEESLSGQNSLQGDNHVLFLVSVIEYLSYLEYRLGCYDIVIYFSQVSRIGLFWIVLVLVGFLIRDLLPELLWFSSTVGLDLKFLCYY